MKFTKFTSAALVAATALSAIAAPVSTFAATPSGKDNAAENGGQALPQTDITDGAISFGDVNPNGNTGYLRLQMVPHTLDFGNHATFDLNRTNFDATGANVGNKTNNTHASYDLADANKTEKLTTDLEGLDAVNGTAWTTVVDKQDSKQFTADSPAEDGVNDAVPGSWSLTVAPTKELSSNSKTISDAQLTFKNTKYGETTSTEANQVFLLTNEDQDKDYAITAAPKSISDISNTVSMNLSDLDKAQPVATAAAGEGAGANVFGWNPTDITLDLSSDAANVTTGEYHTELTWTLNSTVQ